MSWEVAKAACLTYIFQLIDGDGYRLVRAFILLSLFVVQIPKWPVNAGAHLTQTQLSL
jgi:hypothetical protein